MGVDRADLFQRLGTTLSALRQEAGLTQEELAHRADLHRTYIGSLERGDRNPTVTTLLKIAKALPCTPSELMRRAFK